MGVRVLSSAHQLLNMAGKTKTTAKPKIKAEAKAPEVKVEEKKLPFEKTADGTIELRLTIPWSKIKVTWDLVVEEMAKNANLPGFRKGKAPKNLVEGNLDKAKIRDEVVRHLLPQAYAQAIRDNNVKPIIDPRIHVDEALVEEKDWEFHAITCEAPVVELNGYKEEVKKVTAKSKIVVPGKEAEAPKFEEIVKVLLDKIQVTIPQVLIEREVDRLLTQTLEEIKKLGMTLDQYLASTKKTAEDIRGESAVKANTDLKLEFILQKIAESEKISVDDAEIEKTIANANPEEKESLRANKYLLASIIRQQKTLDFLKNL